MPFLHTTVLATSWLNEPKLGQRAARSLLVGAAVLAVRQTFVDWSLDLQTHSTTVTDPAADTMLWLAERLRGTRRLLLWRAEDIVLPSLIAAAETARDTVVAAELLRRLDGALAGEVVDVAAAHGGSRARSFDAVAHAHGLPYIAQSREQLAEAHRTGCHGAIRAHLAARATSTWRLWLEGQPDAGELTAATERWLTERTDAPAPAHLAEVRA